ncbi:hypothetical protein GGI15_002664 [Coemansia interrupta]|uniref:Ca3427-like PBP 2 domain-containing protein n=1 Tax=Coemansia interrupta TaxID=1126814 RepID=A0A9W8HK99_9FUNG|nr:hypothetical protein GGI15_002664 [Coemansia interrupta]
MVKKLAAGELYVAICVTEGLVSGIRNNKQTDLRLFGTYVDTPLPWAVSVATDAKFCSIDDLAFGATFGISRNGSGSEVMARYAASQYEWTSQPKFAVLGDINNLVQGVQQGKVDAFMWEKTTMQRHYSAEEVRYLGTVRPPWPAFSFGATEDYIRRNSERLSKLLEQISLTTQKFMQGSGSLEFICQRLGYDIKDAQQWAGYVGFSRDGSVDDARIEAVVRALTRAGVIEACTVDNVVLRPAQESA